MSCWVSQTERKSAEAGFFSVIIHHCSVGCSLDRSGSKILSRLIPRPSNKASETRPRPLSSGLETNTILQYNNTGLTHIVFCSVLFPSSRHHHHPIPLWLNKVFPVKRHQTHLVLRNLFINNGQYTAQDCVHVFFCAFGFDHLKHLCVAQGRLGQSIRKQSVSSFPLHRHCTKDTQTRSRGLCGLLEDGIIEKPTSAET